MTPAFDTPNVCIDKTLTDLKLDGRKEEDNINQKQNVTANFLTEDENLYYPVNKSLSSGYALLQPNEFSNAAFLLKI